MINGLLTFQVNRFPLLATVNIALLMTFNAI